MTGIYTDTDNVIYYDIAIYKIDTLTHKTELLSVLRKVEAFLIRSIINLLTPLIKMVNDPRTTIRYAICIS